MVESATGDTAKSFEIELRIESCDLPLNVVRAMCSTYPDLVYDEEQDRLTGHAPIDSESIADDFRFWQTHPGVPAENVGSRLDNYKPKTPMQRQLKGMARHLVYEGVSERVMGIVCSGSTGLGKTHVSVGVAKALEQAGQRARYINPKTMHTDFNSRKGISQFYREAGGKGVLIADDINNPYAVEGEIIRGIVTALHEYGGRLLVCTNADARGLFDKAFKSPGMAKEADAQRLWSCLGHAVRFIQMDGEDYRQTQAQDPWAFYEEK